MLEPTDRVKIAIASLRNDNDFQEIMEWLRKEKERCDTRSPLIVEDPKYRWNQGNLQILNPIIETVDNIDAILQSKRVTKRRK